MTTYSNSASVLGGLLLATVLLFSISAVSALHAQELGDTEDTTTEDVPSAETGTSFPFRLESLPGSRRVDGDFVVGPGKIELQLEPGESRTVELSLSNRTGERRIFNFEAEDMAGTNDPDRPIVLLGDDRGPYSLKDYVTIPESGLELDHNRRAVIPVTITIPPDAEPGGLYGSVLVTTVTKDSGERAGGDTVPRSPIIARIGTLFFITVPGDIEHEGTLTDFSIIPDQLFYQEGPINFGILFENTGSIHLAPYGELRIHNMLGEEVGSVELDSWFALPDSVRLREVSWNREFLLGRYTATLKVNRSYDNIVDTATVSFIVLPWKILVATLVILILLILIIRYIARNFEFRKRDA